MDDEIDIHRVCRMTGFSRATVYRRIEKEGFPRPRLKGRKGFWSRALVERWMDSHIPEIWRFEDIPDNKAAWLVMRFMGLGALHKRGFDAHDDWLKEFQDWSLGEMMKMASRHPEPEKELRRQIDEYLRTFGERGHLRFVQQASKLLEMFQR